MAYAELKDVAKKFKNLDISATTVISISDVNDLIDEFSALIDSYIGAVYVTPVTAGESAVMLLRLYCSTLVADEIKKILEVKAPAQTEALQDVRGAFTAKDVLKALSDIKKGVLTLQGATSLINNGNSVFYSENAANNVEPQWKKDVEQW